VQHSTHAQLSYGDRLQVAKSKAVWRVSQACMVSQPLEIWWCRSPRGSQYVGTKNNAHKQ
jgi:hypothetical protein